MKHLWKALCKISSQLDKNMVAMGNSCFWLAEIKKKSPLQLGGTMNCYFVGMMYGRSCTNLPCFVPIIHLIWPP
jgi:hypothetical protein